MDRVVWMNMLRAVIAAVASGVFAWLVGQVLRRLGRRHDLPSLVGLDYSCRPAWISTVVSIALLVSANGNGFPVGWRRAAVIAVIWSACWLLVRLLVVGEQIVLGRLRVDVEDNRRIRRARTQVTLLRRVLGAVVIVVGLATALMTFPQLRTFGASLLASAGLAGIVAGLAAQTTLANIIAGLQLAFTDAVRIDDVVVVEEEWGWIEELTLTYVVVHIWDERRLVLPTSYFTTTPFQNWTRTQARLLGAVILNLDYATPLGPLRAHAHAVISASPLWDGKDWVLQVVDTTPTTMVVRILASAADAPSAWDLRCDIREALIVFLQQNYPQSLPVTRVLPMNATPFATWPQDLAAQDPDAPDPAFKDPAFQDPAVQDPVVQDPADLEPSAPRPEDPKPAQPEPADLRTTTPRPAAPQSAAPRPAAPKPAVAQPAGRTPVDLRPVDESKPGTSMADKAPDTATPPG